MKIGIKACIGLVWMMGTACQLAVDLDGYWFDVSDAGADVTAIEPAPASSANDAALEQEPAALGPQVGLDADDGVASGAAPDEQAEPTPAPPEPEQPEPSRPEPEPEASEPPPPDPDDGCSIIEYCYAHLEQDTTDEERCIQRGCTLDDAIDECRREIANRCGTAPQPPYVMITLAGQRVIVDP